MKLSALIDHRLLEQHVADGYVRRALHVSLPLAILNYTEKAQYENVWDDVTKTCRGVIYRTDTLDVVARPFPKFFNYGQAGAPELNLDAPAIVTDKLDGSLGIVYPSDDGYAVATRGSFNAAQALHATSVLRSRYAEWAPTSGTTYLFEIIYPGNRIVCDYGTYDDLVFLCALDTATGEPRSGGDWPGPRTEKLTCRTLAEALALQPRPNREGVVMFFPDTGDRVKIKQDDYVALHRILTGTNARNVWEVAAVHACAQYVTEPKHWGSHLRIDPARAAEVLTLGDDWLAEVPDEFYSWVEETSTAAETQALYLIRAGLALVEEARSIPDRKARFDHVAASTHPAAQAVMRLADGRQEEYGRLVMRCWLEARPEPTAPFHHDEATA